MGLSVRDKRSLRDTLQGQPAEKNDCSEYFLLYAVNAKLRTTTMKINEIHILYVMNEMTYPQRQSNNQSNILCVMH